MFHIRYRVRATEEYEEAIKWYAERSGAVAERFINAVNEKLNSISTNPRQYKNLYKGYYEVSTRRYPYTIVYFIDEALNSVIIVAIYHQKRHPKRKYRR